MFDVVHERRAVTFFGDSIYCRLGYSRARAVFVDVPVLSEYRDCPFHGIFGEILAAHERIRARPEGYADMVDQATICWTLGIPIHLVRGNRGNVKITTPEDIVMLEALLKWKGDR